MIRVPGKWEEWDVSLVAGGEELFWLLSNVKVQVERFALD